MAKDSILVDIDNKAESEILFKICTELKVKCRILKTDRGRHFLFKNDSIKSCCIKRKSAIGLTIDVKSGKRDCYEVLKSNGQNRAVEYDTEDYQTIPKWLHPLKGHPSIDFVSMAEGERNSTLYSYILTLQNNGFTPEEAREAIRIINKFVFKDPLPDDELEIILRDEAFGKRPFFKGKTFLHDEFAEYIKAEYHIKKINGQLHIYDSDRGIYIPGRLPIEKAMINEISFLTDAKRKEVLKYLDVTCEKASPSGLNLIAFKNGILDINSNELLDFSPDIVITNGIPWDYNKAAASKVIDDVLNQWACNDKSIRALLEEAAGYCFYRKNLYKKAFLLSGGKDNGKTTYINLLNTMLGESNISSLDFKDLDGRFSTAELFGKLANLGDDISDNFKDDISTFKKISSVSMVTAEFKGQNPFTFESYATLIFSVNNKPRLYDPTGAGINRFVIIPMEAKFSKDSNNYDPGLNFKLKQREAVEYFIVLAVEGLKRVLKNKGFTFSEKSQAEIEEYERENNPILTFINECKEEEYKILNTPTEWVYQKYNGFCINNNYKPLGKINFVKKMNQELGTKSKVFFIKGKAVRCFVEEK
ncbi:MAG: phage/plasmid primase, P4 family [Clostridiales bacterium]|nr:phage/plasmid primase, P4 family [Clostridiales bacterium]